MLSQDTRQDQQNLTSVLVIILTNRFLQNQMNLFLAEIHQEYKCKEQLSIEHS